MRNDAQDVAVRIRAEVPAPALALSVSANVLLTALKVPSGAKLNRSGFTHNGMYRCVR